MTTNNPQPDNLELREAMEQKLIDFTVYDHHGLPYQLKSTDIDRLLALIDKHYVAKDEVDKARLGGHLEALESTYRSATGVNHIIEDKDFIAELAEAISNTKLRIAQLQSNITKGGK